MLDVKFPDKVKLLREKNGWTQTYLGLLMGDAAPVGKWEQGLKYPKPEYQDKLNWYFRAWGIKEEDAKPQSTPPPKGRTMREEYKSLPCGTRILLKFTAGGCVHPTSSLALFKDGLKYCRGCDFILGIYSFNVDRYKSCGLGTRCRECQNKQNRARSKKAESG